MACPNRKSTSRIAKVLRRRVKSKTKFCTLTQTKACEQSLHLRVRSGRGGYSVYRASACRGIECEFKQADEVGDMDPRDLLFTAAEHCAEAEAHRPRELRQRSAAAG